MAEELIKPPSRIRWGIVKIIALLNDLYDFGEGITTAIAAYFGVVVGGFAAAILTGLIQFIILDIPMIVLIPNAKKEYGDVIESAIEEIDMHHRKITAIRTQYAFALRQARKISFLRKPVNRIALRFADIRKTLAKSIWARFWKRIGVNKVPYVDILYWQYFAVRKEEKMAWETYEIALETRREVALARKEAAEAKRQIESLAA